MVYRHAPEDSTIAMENGAEAQVPRKATPTAVMRNFSNFTYLNPESINPRFICQICLEVMVLPWRAVPPCCKQALFCSSCWTVHFEGGHSGTKLASLPCPLCRRPVAWDSLEVDETRLSDLLDLHVRCEFAGSASHPGCTWTDRVATSVNIFNNPAHFTAAPTTSADVNGVGRLRLTT